MKIARKFDALRGFGPQLDLLNTLNGGVVQAAIQVKHHRHALVITITAPSLEPDAFEILLDHQMLTISSANLPFDPMAPRLPNDLRVPLLRQQFRLPAQVDTDRIEATFSGDRLRVTIPIRADNDQYRRIEIRPYP
jgi:HSP20 family protein